MSQMINKSAVRAFALEVARQTGRKFTSVSSVFLEHIDAEVRRIVAARVHAAKGGKRL